MLAILGIHKPDKSHKNMRAAKHLTLKQIGSWALSIVVIVTGLIWGKGRWFAGSDPDKILQITGAAYREGVIQVDFSVNHDKLKRAAARDVRLGQWRQNAAGDQSFEELAGYAIKIKIPNPHDISALYGSLGMEWPLDAQGVRHYSVPLLLPELYQEWSDTQSYFVQVEAWLRLNVEYREANTERIDHYPRGVCAGSRKRAVFWPVVLPVSDLTTIKKHEPIDKTRGASIRLEDYGVFNIPAGTLDQNCEVDVTVTVALRALDYFISFELPDRAGIQLSNLPRLNIPYQILGPWQELRLLWPDGLLTRIEPAWVNPATKTISLSVSNACGTFSLLAGVREPSIN